MFYEVFVRSFADSDDDGSGDLRGLIGHLDHLNDGDPSTTADLGVTGLWLMPTFPSPSYHGYDVTDYRSVNPDYGSLADMRALVRDAHQRGIAVILDLPLNHTSDQDPWFRDSRKPGSAHADWYVWANEPGGSGWAADGKRYYYAGFGPGFPELNLREPAVTAELTRDARFWLEDVGVDGFRLDAAKHLIEDGPVTENTPATHAWLHDLRTTLGETRPGTLLLGEVWDTSKISASYVPDALDMTFDFGLATAYVSTVQGGQAWSLQRALTNTTGLYPAGGFGAFLTNHDMDRVASQLGGDAAKMRLAAELLLTGPGVPFVYYGEEIGMTGAKPDEQIRTPMRWDSSLPAAGFSQSTPWEPLSSDGRPVDVADQTSDASSLLSLYRDLIRLRGAHPALAGGSLVPVTTAAPSLVATLRSLPGETDLVIANVGATPVSDYTLDLGAGPLCGRPAATALFGLPAGDGPDTTPTAPAVSADGGFSGYRPLATLPARSVAVIQLAP
ncbi:MAG: alpha-amylase [Chloroflexota bacterium]|nr:alpha-amylase [Chloroflexota bacterium]